MASGSLKTIKQHHSYGEIPTFGPALKITRLPQTEDELWHWYRTVLGVQFPRKQCCADHVAPFQLVCDVYFRRHPVVLVTGSRGFSGKSYTLAAMAIGEAILHGVPVNVLGGSASQSLNVHEISQQVWWQNYAPRHLLARDPSRFETTLVNGGRIRALLASSRSVRGPHPNVLCLDEADEMEIDIVDAALGQPMPQMSGTTGQRIKAVTVIISTHHYPHGCVAGTTLVLTDRGEVPVVDVKTSDRVMTRKGWRPVEKVVFSGYKPVVEIELSSGRVLTVTDDHRIAVPGGWSIPRWMSVGQEVCGIDPHAVVVEPQVVSHRQSGSDSLVALLEPRVEAHAGLTASASGLRLDVGVADRVGMSLRASGLLSVDGGRTHSTENVGRLGDWLQVAGIAAGSDSAEMIELMPILDGSNQAEPRPDVRPTVEVLAVNPAVPLGLGTTPYPAVTKLRAQGAAGESAPAQEPLTIVRISHKTSVDTPVYDLQVQDVHEFVGNGVVVHNTMTELLERARERGHPSYRWCYRETELTPSNPTGWLETATIEQKRQEINPRMWQIEYDLGDPAVKDTLIDPMSVEAMWDLEEGYFEGKPGEEIFIERPRRNFEYAHGVDWAKKRDWTVHMVWRPSDNGWRLVYFCRQNRRPWPDMVGQVMNVLKKYPGTLCHDATGVGDVISDLFPEEARAHRNIRDIIMRGESRSQMFSDYVRAIEGGMFKAPRIKWAYEEHLYLQYEALYSPAGHPPDSVVSGSMAWLGRDSAYNLILDSAMMGLGSFGNNSEWAMQPAGAGPGNWDSWSSGAGGGGWSL